MKSPRIYLYKVTFEEIPDFYWGIHKEKSFEDGYLGSPITHAWKWDFYTPHLQVCEVFDYSEAGWKEAHSVEKRVIRNDLNNPLCLNEHCGGYFSLDSCRKAGQIGGAIAVKKLNSEVNEEGKSVRALKGAITIHAIKDEDGKSIVAKKTGKLLHSCKWEDPDHPEIGAHSCGTLTKMQRARGLPSGKNNRRRVK
jgi:hypothetical protein